MILNHGNIKKSKFLRYMFLDDLLDEQHVKKFAEYQKTIQNNSFSDYLKIQPYLHDSKITISKVDNDIVIKTKYRDKELQDTILAKLIFENAKIVSWNKFRKSGHISRMNREIIPYEFGYDEFYENNGDKYVSIIVFTKYDSKIKIGAYYPMLTIKYQRIKVVKNT